VKIDRYEVVDEIKRGGESIVYRARDPELHRDVAIKVIESPPGDDAERRLDEARAMAKVSHPQLVPIFDVGATRDGIYIVMPFLSGGTLADWLRVEQRPWNAIVDRFVKAGSGLVAAHAAGLVHGSFSAADVLLDREDVLVGDFGLFAGDAKADRDAFSNAFLDALDGRGPAWLVAILGRPWPSIGAMLDRIESRRRLPGHIAVVGVAVGIVAAAAFAFVSLRSDAPTPCPAPTARLAQTWTPQRRADLEKAMLATKLPYAEDAVARVLPAIDAYVNDWQSMYIATCRATQVAHTQPAAMLDKKMRCLDRRLASLTGRMSALFASDQSAIVTSATTFAALPAIADCADEKTLDKALPLPADPQRRAAVERTLAEIADLESFGIAGEPAEYLRRAHTLVARTRLQEYVPAHVAAMHSLATAQGRNSQSAELTLRELVAAAARAGDDVSISLAWSSLAFQLVSLERLDEAKQLLPAATTATTRAGERSDTRFHLARVTGVLACETGEQETCIGKLTEAVSLAPDQVAKSDALMSLISGYANSGDFPGARRIAGDYLKLNEELVGTNHPRYADALYIQARLRFSSGDPTEFDRVIEEMDRVIAIRAAAFGENHPDIAAALIGEATIFGSQSKFPEAERAARRALAIADAVHDVKAQTQALRLVATTVAEQGRLPEARPLFERAIEILREHYGTDSRDVASFEAPYANVLQEAGDCASAVPLARESARILERLHDPKAAVSFKVLALCSITAGAVDEGDGYFKRSIAICEVPGTCPTGHLETVRGYYAEWLISTGRDRQGGAALLRRTRDVYAQMGRTKDVGELNEFLAKYHLPTK
jgi:tetratricopeptide (TPR) repeat protein/tRNA A-37 threonylcarbamoyl transferase component Bud32